MPVLILSGCGRDSHDVKAAAVGVPALDPFFDEGQGLGHDKQAPSLPVRGNLQQGDAPGLYGGTRQPTICDVEKLKKFLTDPANHRKAQAWAGVFKISTEHIPDFLDRLTPVLLRHDTLVKNHDYRSGTAVPYDSLLQAGIAVLVDQQGQPAVKCSCGNPLRPFKGDTGRIKVDFEHGNKEWPGYDEHEVTAVRPAARPLRQLALVDVADPERGFERPVGTTGAHDTVFSTGEQHAVPDVIGLSFGAASGRLSGAGLAVAYDSAEPPPDDARVLASDPVAGTPLTFGEYVTLRVAGGTSGDDSGGSSSSGSGSVGGQDSGSSSSSDQGSSSSDAGSPSSDAGSPSSDPGSPSSSSSSPSGVSSSGTASDSGTPSRAASPLASGPPPPSDPPSSAYQGASPAPPASPDPPPDSPSVAHSATGPSPSKTEPAAPSEPVPADGTGSGTT
ncbi:PASTA domain-containing protein [Streptomyces sp. NPDC091215]|uniref:PASTA domain-containing protein n=1 Tax=Streptomyces sp. NPDC091215 TaxID=3155192 RepID=UPI00343F60F3